MSHIPTLKSRYAFFRSYPRPYCLFLRRRRRRSSGRRRVCSGQLLPLSSSLLTRAMLGKYSLHPPILRLRNCPITRRQQSTEKIPVTITLLFPQQRNAIWHVFVLFVRIFSVTCSSACWDASLLRWRRAWGDKCYILFDGCEGRGARKRGLWMC